ncbi:hypothetical protein [Microvirga vignae]|uniref:hypothetical protein n=1 Tax=Microvirga vignae TaxID=1225564 RepID=UPI0012375D93|nr:hypothetical protein [Microvirga vignae]
MLTRDVGSGSKGMMQGQHRFFPRGDGTFNGGREHADPVASQRQIGEGSQRRLWQRHCGLTDGGALLLHDAGLRLAISLSVEAQFSQRGCDLTPN